MRSETEVSAMSCPVCRVPLSMSERQGIEIDYCPQCRGVWLDRGELDKIIERSAPPEEAAAPARPQARPEEPLHTGGQRNPWAPEGLSQGGYGHGGRGYGSKGHYKKKKHWLSEIFDD